MTLHKTHIPSTTAHQQPQQQPYILLPRGSPTLSDDIKTELINSFLSISHHAPREHLSEVNHEGKPGSAES